MMVSEHGNISDCIYKYKIFLNEHPIYSHQSCLYVYLVKALKTTSPGLAFSICTAKPGEQIDDLPIQFPSRVS